MNYYALTRNTLSVGTRVGRKITETDLSVILQHVILFSLKCIIELCGSAHPSQNLTQVAKTSWILSDNFIFDSGNRWIFTMQANPFIIHLLPDTLHRCTCPTSPTYTWCRPAPWATFLLLCPWSPRTSGCKGFPRRSTGAIPRSRRRTAGRCRPNTVRPGSPIRRDRAVVKQTVIRGVYSLFVKRYGKMQWRTVTVRVSGWRGRDKFHWVRRFLKAIHLRVNRTTAFNT